VCIGVTVSELVVAVDVIVSLVVVVAFSINVVVGVAVFEFDTAHEAKETHSTHIDPTHLRCVFVAHLPCRRTIPRWAAVFC
jgi:hypothetical protein